MGELFIIALAGFVSVFTLGFQSRNVNHGNYGWAAGTSVFVGVSQAQLWSHITAAGAGLISSLVYAFSGAAGITLSMYVHKRWIQKETNSKESSAS